jgi:pyruvate formate-lyase activating enzyme-like uncharacterized protein
MDKQTKKQRIQAIRKAVGWAYPQLNWLTDEEAVRATEERDKLLMALSGKINTSYMQNKLHQGPLSPGCMTCGNGTWSCLFVNQLCTSHCFFCPQDRSEKKEHCPEVSFYRHSTLFHKAQDYADFVQKVGYKGVGFSGGESLLVYDTLISYIVTLRKKLGSDIYIWAYTNGDLVNRDKLTGLKRAGLDEIRFNTAPNHYALHSVELALNLIDTVTVEIPAIPEDFEAVKASISTMKSMGVHHLNLHQLITTPHNYKALIRRNYSFLHHTGVPVFESEMTALKLLLYAVEEGISLPINYCSQAYKTRLQGRGHLVRTALLVKEGFEDITDSGYIRRITAQSEPDNIERLAEAVRTTTASNDFWSLSEDRTELALHPSLLKHVDSNSYLFTLCYFLPYMKDSDQHFLQKNTPTNRNFPASHHNEKVVFHPNADSEETVQEIEVNPGRKLLAIKRLEAKQKGLSLAAIRSFEKIFIEKKSEKETLRWFLENYDIASKKNIQDMARERDILMILSTWERVPEGFPEIY